MKTITKSSSKSIALVGLFTALIVALSQLCFPLPSGIPVTLQTFAISLCGYVIGWKKGFAAVWTYIILGAFGLPVFSNFGGGFGILFGITGGFIWGFLLLAVMCGIGIKSKNAFQGITFGLLGLAMCHLLGVMQFSFVTSTPVSKAVLLVSLPYLIKDIVSVAGAYFIAVAARKALAKSNLGKDFI